MADKKVIAWAIFTRGSYLIVALVFFAFGASCIVTQKATPGGRGGVVHKFEGSEAVAIGIACLILALGCVYRSILGRGYKSVRVVILGWLTALVLVACVAYAILHKTRREKEEKQQAGGQSVVTPPTLFAASAPAWCAPTRGTTSATAAWPARGGFRVGPVLV
jgi:hypothetical protein